ncbi:MAG: hypothetical protein E6Q97_10945 [Desulfurellales bacterium]|nr:MAG: hypothetical protein E6Q97_10945 [Desulfurellales bacterium]
MTEEEKQWAQKLWDHICNGRPLVMRPKGWWTRLRCKHAYSHWLRNLYGDMIPSNGYRSRWQCTKCGAIGTMPGLAERLEREELGPSPFVRGH